MSDSPGKKLADGQIADTILSSMRDGLVIMDSSGRPIWINDAAVRMHGYRDQQHAFREFARLLSKAGGYQVRDADGSMLPCEAWPIAKSSRFEVFDCLEVTIVHEASGHGWTGSFSGLPVELPGDQRLFVMSCQDISERKQTEIHLRETASNLEHLVEERAGAIRLLHDVTAACHRASTVGEALDLVLKLFSQFNGWCFGHAYLLANENPDLLIPVREYYEDLPGRFDAFRSATRHLRLRRSQGLPGRTLHSGQVLWTNSIAEGLVERPAKLGEDLGIVSAIAIPVVLGGETVGAIEFFSDKPIDWDDRMVDVGRAVGSQVGRVIERKHLERLLAKQTAEQQRQIAQQIHDTVSQQISGVSIMAETLRQELVEIDSPLAGQTGRLVDYLKAGQEQLRRITRGLMPVEVDSKGLMKALEDLAETTRKLHGLDCHFECERPVAVDDNATATNLFYIVQEAVHNAVKHSNATHVFIQMKLNRDLLRLLVRDDGNGMDSVSRGVGGVGIRIMRHRAGVIGADLDIVSQPASGTTVLCYLTLEHEQQHE